jgi:hypothetical protein
MLQRLVVPAGPAGVGGRSDRRRQLVGLAIGDGHQLEVAAQDLQGDRSPAAALEVGRQVDHLRRGRRLDALDQHAGQPQVVGPTALRVEGGEHHRVVHEGARALDAGGRAQPRLEAPILGHAGAAGDVDVRVDPEHAALELVLKAGGDRLDHDQRRDPEDHADDAGGPEDRRILDQQQQQPEEARGRDGDHQGQALEPEIEGQEPAHGHQEADQEGDAGAPRDPLGADDPQADRALVAERPDSNQRRSSTARAATPTQAAVTRTGGRSTNKVTGPSNAAHEVTNSASKTAWIGRRVDAPWGRDPGPDAP